MNANNERDPRLFAIPDTHGHAKGEHKPYVEERPLPLTARMLFLWFYHACRRGYPRFLMVADHMNYLTFEDPAAVNLVRRALKLAQAGDLYGAAETASVDVGHAAVVSEGLRRGMRYSIGAEVDNDPRSRPDAQNIVDAMRPDAIIRSIHFIPITHPVHGENWPWPFDNPEFQDMFDVVGAERTWEVYVAALVDAIERLPGHIVGHFFVPAVFGHWPDDAALDEYENRVLEAAAARGMAVEFNTRFLYRDHSDEERRRYIDANKRFLRKAKDRGVAIAIGSDAHSPKDQGGAFATVLAVLDELDINEIVFPLAGQLRRVALRVVREPEPEPEPEPTPPPPEPKAAAPDRGAATDGATAAEPAKAVRKARPAPKATRPAATSPERPPERPETSVATAEAPPEHADPTTPPAPAEAGPPAELDGTPAASTTPARPARVRKSRAKPKPGDAAPAAETTQPPTAAPNASPAKPASAKSPAAVKAPATAKASAGTKAPATAKAPAPAKVPAKPPAAKTSGVVKPTAKAAAAKAAPAKAAASKAARSKSPAAKAGTAKVPAGKAAASSARVRPSAGKAKATPAKAGAKKATSAKTAPAKGAAKKARPARPAAKKAAAPKKGASAKKAAPKKATPARAGTKKAAPKKAAPKKAASARATPARSAAAGKKTAKKTAPKRR